MYVSEGTEETTQLFYDNPGGDYTIHDITPVDNTSFYFCGDDGIAGSEPWFSDGTSSGTYLIKDVNPNGDSCWGETKSSSTVSLSGKAMMELMATSPGLATGQVMAHLCSLTFGKVQHIHYFNKIHQLGL